MPGLAASVFRAGRRMRLHDPGRQGRSGWAFGNDRQGAGTRGRFGQPGPGGPKRRTASAARSLAQPISTATSRLVYGTKKDLARPCEGRARSLLDKFERYRNFFALCGITTLWSGRPLSPNDRISRIVLSALAHCLWGLPAGATHFACYEISLHIGFHPPSGVSFPASLFGAALHDRSNALCPIVKCCQAHSQAVGRTGRGRVQDFIPARDQRGGQAKGMAAGFRAAGPGQHPAKGRKRLAGGDAGPAKRKKAFWEPPKKPFCKMFIQRKVFSIEQESCQNWAWLQSTTNNRKYSMLYLWPDLFSQNNTVLPVQNPLPFRESRPRRAEICTAWSGRTPPVRLRPVAAVNGGRHSGPSWFETTTGRERSVRLPARNARRRPCQAKRPRPAGFVPDAAPINPVSVDLAQAPRPGMRLVFRCWPGRQSRSRRPRRTG